MNEAADVLGKGGSWSYTWTDFAEAFAALPPLRATLVSARPRLDGRCTNACYTQFLKLDQCLDMVRQTEYEENITYDFVVRLRPDFFVDVPFPSVFSLKRAAYAPTWHGGINDQLFYAHRDFADAAFGMTRLLPYGESDCAMHAHLVEFMRTSKVCGGGVNCECWPRTSLKLHGATVITGPHPFSAHVVRLGASTAGGGG